MFGKPIAHVPNVTAMGASLTPCVQAGYNLIAYRALGRVGRFAFVTVPTGGGHWLLALATNRVHRGRLLI